MAPESIMFGDISPFDYNQLELTNNENGGIPVVQPRILKEVRARNKQSAGANKAQTPDAATDTPSSKFSWEGIKKLSAGIPSAKVFYEKASTRLSAMRQGSASTATTAPAKPTAPAASPRTNTKYTQLSKDYLKNEKDSGSALRERLERFWASVKAAVMNKETQAEEEKRLKNGIAATDDFLTNNTAKSHFYPDVEYHPGMPGVITMIDPSTGETYLDVTGFIMSDEATKRKFIKNETAIKDMEALKAAYKGDDLSKQHRRAIKEKVATQKAAKAFMDDADKQTAEDKKSQKKALRAAEKADKYAKKRAASAAKKRQPMQFPLFSKIAAAFKSRYDQTVDAVKSRYNRAVDAVANRKTNKTTDEYRLKGRVYLNNSADDEIKMAQKDRAATTKRRTKIVTVAKGSTKVAIGAAGVTAGSIFIPVVASLFLNNPFAKVEASYAQSPATPTPTAGATAETKATTPPVTLAKTGAPIAPTQQLQAAPEPVKAVMANVQAGQASPPAQTQQTAQRQEGRVKVTATMPATGGVSKGKGSVPPKTSLKAATAQTAAGNSNTVLQQTFGINEQTLAATSKETRQGLLAAAKVLKDLEKNPHKAITQEQAYKIAVPLLVGARQISESSANNPNVVAKMYKAAEKYVRAGDLRNTANRAFIDTESLNYAKLYLSGANGFEKNAGFAAIIVATIEKTSPELTKSLAAALNKDNPTTLPTARHNLQGTPPKPASGYKSASRFAPQA